MPLSYFSDTSEIRRPASGLVRNDIPERVRNAVANMIEAWRDRNAGNYGDPYRATGDMWVWTVYQLDWRAGLVSEFSSTNHENLRTTIETGAWSDVLDVFTAIFLFLERFQDEYTQQLPEASEFAERLNGAFLRHYSAYQITDDGQIEEPGAQAAQAAVAEARAILTDPRLGGPDRQYQTALIAFARRPEADYEATVSNAINAVEGVARIVLGKPNASLGDAAKDIARTKGLHGALADTIGKLYGYASQEAGRHGLVGDPKVDRPIAEFCLHQAAAMIVLLARLYGYDVVEGTGAQSEKDGT